jgi:hypothetical protein
MKYGESLKSNEQQKYRLIVRVIVLDSDIIFYLCGPSQVNEYIPPEALLDLRFLHSSEYVQQS